MPTVQVTMPRMLADLVRGDRRFEVSAADVRGVLDEVIGRHPELAVHLFDESGAIREHVSVFHNGRTAGLRCEVAAGDHIVILQAVSGG